MYQPSGQTDALGQPPAGSRLFNVYMNKPPTQPPMMPTANSMQSSPRSFVPAESQHSPQQNFMSQAPSYVPTSSSMLNANAAPFQMASPVSSQQNNYGMAQAQMQMSNMNFYQQQDFQESIVGGTTYFGYDEATGQMMTDQQRQEYMSGSMDMNQVPMASADSLGIPVVPDFYMFSATPPHLARLRPKASAMNTYFTPSENKNEVLNRQLVTLGQPDPQRLDIPHDVESYRQLCPLEARHPDAETPGYFLAHRSSVYKTQYAKDGLYYCLRRLHGCRLGTTKSLTVCDMWKKLVHSNVVQLRDVFTTKAFNDISLVFIYDYHPMAETLRARHFNAQGSLQTSRVNGMHDAPTLNKFASANGLSGLPESIIWSYIIQLSSALRAIHSAGLAARVVDPTKILMVGKSKLMLNGAGIMDLLTFESTQSSMSQAVQMWQNEDLYGLGRLIVALACGSLHSATRDALQSSIMSIAQNYSTDLKNIVTYLLSPNPPGRSKSINEVMPMIGARFYAQLESAQMRNDLLENELSKEVENGRLFRLISKLAIICDRPDGGSRQSWSETGDRYLLKLFRGYVFHAVTAEGIPWVDMAHIMQCLNKLDAGVPEKLQLMSPDGKNVLIVSYADLRRCVQQAWIELTQTNTMPMH